jgi:hypothetical protein
MLREEGDEIMEQIIIAIALLCQINSSGKVYSPEDIDSSQKACQKWYVDCMGGGTWYARQLVECIKKK